MSHDPRDLYHGPGAPLARPRPRTHNALASQAHTAHAGALVAVQGQTQPDLLSAPLRRGEARAKMSRLSWLFVRGHHSLRKHAQLHTTALPLRRNATRSDTPHVYSTVCISACTPPFDAAPLYLHCASILFLCVHAPPAECVAGPCMCCLLQRRPRCKLVGEGSRRCTAADSSWTTGAARDVALHAHRLEGSRGTAMTGARRGATLRARGPGPRRRIR